MAHLALALASRSARKRSEARAAAEKALRLDPELGEAHNLLGLLELDRNRGSVAQKHLEDALRHEPEEPAFLNNLGLALEAQGKKKEAIEWFLRAGRLDPRHEHTQKSLHRTTRAWIRGGIAAVLFVTAVRIVLLSRHFSFRWVLLSAGLVVLVVWAWINDRLRQQRLDELSPEARLLARSRRESTGEPTPTVASGLIALLAMSDLDPHHVRYFLAGCKVHLCGWCTLDSDRPIQSEDALIKELAAARARFVSWRWR